MADYCRHATLERMIGGYWECIDCNSRFDIVEIDHKKPQKQPENAKVIPQTTQKRKKEMSQNQTLIIVLVAFFLIAMLGGGAFWLVYKGSNFGSDALNLGRLDSRSSEVAETPEKAICEPQVVEKIIKVPTKCEITEKIVEKPVVHKVYVPSPNKCTCDCTSQIKAACGALRDAVDDCWGHRKAKQPIESKGYWDRKKYGSWEDEKPDDEEYDYCEDYPEEEECDDD